MFELQHISKVNTNPVIDNRFAPGTLLAINVAQARLCLLGWNKVVVIRQGRLVIFDLADGEGVMTYDPIFFDKCMVDGIDILTHPRIITVSRTNRSLPHMIDVNYPDAVRRLLDETDKFRNEQGGMGSTITTTIPRRKE
jgi:hypothetical protein